MDIEYLRKYLSPLSSAMVELELTNYSWTHINNILTGKARNAPIRAKLIALAHKRAKQELRGQELAEKIAARDKQVATK